MSDNDTRPTRATMTVPEAGELLGLSRRSAYRAAAGGHIPIIRIGSRMLVPTARLHALLGLADPPHSSGLVTDGDPDTMPRVTTRSEGPISRASRS